jgi:hypothetical protein
MISSDKTSLVASFLTELGVRASRTGTAPGGTHSMFVSRGLIDLAAERLDRRDERRGFPEGFLGYDLAPHELAPFGLRVIPEALAEDVDVLVERLARASYQTPNVMGMVLDAAFNLIGRGFYGRGVLGSLLLALGRNVARTKVLDADLDWSRLFAAGLSSGTATRMLRLFVQEVNANVGGEYDFDIAYATDVAMRILEGQIKLSEPLSDDVLQRAHEALQTAREMYSSIANHKPSADGIVVDDIMAEVQTQIDQEPDGSDPFEDEPPF